MCEKNMRNKIVAVVVTYNRKELLQQCIDSVLKQKNCSCDIIVVDNASTDGTQEMMIKQYDVPEVIYINTGTNLGGAGGFQFGIKKAVLFGYEYVWIMDDDTLPEEKALYELFEADKKLEGKWGFLSSAVYWTDGSICMANRPKDTLFSHIYADECSDSIVPVIMSSFVSILMKMEVIKIVGLPIREYFIWTDDYEFSGRISRKYPCYLVTQSRVTHAMMTHSNANIATDSILRLDRYFCLYRNDVHCYRQYGFNGWIYIILKDIYTLANILIRSKDNRVNRVKTVCKGFRVGLHFKPDIENIME